MFGGSFDPPHLAHLKIIKYCSINFDKLIIVPANKSPMKEYSPIASFHARVQMLELMTSDISDNIDIDTYEFDSGQENSYTIHTVKYLLEKYNTDKIFLVLGSDQLEKFSLWKDFDELKELVEILCFSRPGFPFIPINFSYEKNKNLNIDFSSSDVRKMFYKGSQNVSKFISGDVNDYVIQNRLYC